MSEVPLRQSPAQILTHIYNFCIQLDNIIINTLLETLSLLIPYSRLCLALHNILRSKQYIPHVHARARTHTHTYLARIHYLALHNIRSNNILSCKHTSTFSQPYINALHCTTCSHLPGAWHRAGTKILFMKEISIYLGHYYLRIQEPGTELGRESKCPHQQVGGCLRIGHFHLNVYVSPNTPSTSAPPSSVCF